VCPSALSFKRSLAIKHCLTPVAISGTCGVLPTLHARGLSVRDHINSSMIHARRRVGGFQAFIAFARGIELRRTLIAASQA
jgi:hypothetical protein